ncbi:complement C4-like isoform X2 [Bufo gargarizans]|uniref:complement C4-like isoform X2 n=1 Tax=Bufo gargarizans TaxID=30331 RepID=UPI001CF2B269|nr:complement C4-like isoform X2 [Bufo gargarizans]
MTTKIRYRRLAPSILSIWRFSSPASGIMGTSTLLCCLLWANIFSMSEAQSPWFLITAPRLLHLGLGEDVWVQVEWPQGPGSGDVNVEMYLRNQITYDVCSKRYTVTLNQRNNYITRQTIELTPQMATLCKLDEKKHENYVQLVIKSPSISAKPQVVSIPVSYKKGYIFIQTDKSIYTPKETVRFRVFTLDHMMRPTLETTTCTVSNAEGLQVATFQKVASLISEKIQIPDISTSGVWKISAFYNSAPESNSTAEFEVKKYVLPNFEVKIIPVRPYFLVSEKEFTINIEVRYVYGEPVSGITYVRLGIIGQDGQKTILSGLEQNVKLKEGDGTVHISKDDVVKKISQPEENLVGSTLYIAVSVMETASGTIEEKELTSVKFVRSPYILDLSKTKRYFNPGMPVTVVAEVTHSDGSPAPGVTVKLFISNVEQNSFISDKNGKTFFQINTGTNQESFELKVTAGGEGVRQEEPLTLTPYNSKANSFLHLEIPNQILSPGENLKASMKVLTPDFRKVKKVYYMILNKGQILDLKSIDRGDFMAVNVPVTTRMVPSFRIIAYYYLSSEIVANSAWVDVTDACEGKLELRTNVLDSIQPGKSFQLTIETDDTTSVSLSAVDTAVYLLNSKNKLTPSKVFKAMNAYDLGCSPGSGKDYKSVFMDAGLAFVSSVGYSKMNEFNCKDSQRKKRSLDFSGLANQRANQFPNQKLKQCCLTGMKLLPPRMERKCEARATRIATNDCRKAFLDCCKYAEELRKKIQLSKQKDVIGRTLNEEEEDEFTDESDVQVRSSFPESWLWRTINVNKKHRETLSVHDSITTWEIQGVGMSEGKGFCVADPIKVRVFKPFHVHLRVPYSVKRFEQMELKPVLYNYDNMDLKVKVSMEKTEGICSATTAAGEPVERIVTVPSKSATSVPFVVVPTGRENLMVTVKALGPNGIGDIVKKPLRVLREGVSVLEEKTYMVDPKDRGRKEIIIDEELPSNMIPDGDFHSSIKLSMDSPINTINNTLSSDGVSRLIRVPYGCGEQTMISTAPGVYALRYLDHTNKWTLLPPDRKDEGLENMRNGYSRILQYRKTDGSYAAWLQRPSSTWLTAFVAKVMSLCRKYIGVDVEEIRKSATYLTTKQSDSGAFLETSPVYHLNMMGGVAGKTADVSLTAYVLVALHHAKDSMPEDDIKVKSSISKAIDFLRSTLENVKEPFPLAIAAYALNLASSDSVLKDTAYSKLMFTAQEDRNKNTLHFGPPGTALAVEATSYALLTTLLQNDIRSAKKMYIWLSEQENYGGGFKSTQDTVMALEALSEYWIKTHTSERNELLVEVNSLVRSMKQEFRLRNEESIQEELRSMGNKFKVKVSGKGTGVLKVLKMYNIIQVENTTCSQLDLEVKVNSHINQDEENDYDEDYDAEEQAMSDEPMRNIDWHDLRSRARREVSRPKEKDIKVLYEVCLKTKSQTPTSGMAIVDITMLSGFEPSTNDLNKLKDGLETYISHYEIQAGRLIMYFEKVSQIRECVTFEAVQSVKISPLQPASAILYDFYEPENKCRVFYGGPDKSSTVSTLCSGDVCQCAEGSCPRKQRPLELKGDARRQFACYHPRVEFGYHVSVGDTREEDAFIVYTVHIVEVLKKNLDENIAERNTRYFYQRSSCKMRLENKEYLIMGQDGQTKDEKGRMRYLLESNAWIEELAGPDTCKATRYRNACNEVKTFMDNYRKNGCMV